MPPSQIVQDIHEGSSSYGIADFGRKKKLLTFIFYCHLRCNPVKHTYGTLKWKTLLHRYFLEEKNKMNFAISYD